MTFTTKPHHKDQNDVLLTVHGTFNRTELEAFIKKTKQEFDVDGVFEVRIKQTTRLN